MAPVAASMPQPRISNKLMTETALKLLLTMTGSAVWPFISAFTTVSSKPRVIFVVYGKVMFVCFLPSMVNVAGSRISLSKVTFALDPQKMVAQELIRKDVHRMKIIRFIC